VFLLAVATLAASANAQTTSSAAVTTQRTAASATAPIATPVLPTDYVIGPEDVLGVVFWREADLSGDVAVRPDGVITLPLIGELQAAGMKPNALRDSIQTAAARYLNAPSVTVIVRQLNSRKVFITGQVVTSGAHALTGPRTVMQLIALAGGLTEYARGEDISIMREEAGRTRHFKFNYKEVTKGRRLEQNIQLQPGDTVVVP
jgi:polysaccharide export outer membrane protein